MTNQINITDLPDLFVDQRISFEKEIFNSSLNLLILRIFFSLITKAESRIIKKERNLWASKRFQPSQ